MLNKVLRVSQIPVIDRYTVENEPVTSLDLMERAVQAWVDCLNCYNFEYESVIVLCGRGNNGGDGFGIARHLKLRNRHVKVFLLGGQAGQSPDCKANCRRWLDMGGEVVELKDVNELDDLALAPSTLVVDALFGSGLNRPLEGVAAALVRKVNLSPALTVAVDIPSGLMGEDNGGNDGSAILRADYTFTFQFPKLAFLLPENAGFVGRWKVLDIGLNRQIIEELPTDWYLTDLEEVKQLLPPQPVFAHKGMNGKALLVAGQYGMLGAALLAARAAVRSGLGLLYAHLPAGAETAMQVSVPEAVLDPDVSGMHFTGAERLGRFDAVAVGPGIGRHPDTVEALSSLLRDWRGRTVLDADALNIISEHRPLLSLLHEGCVLTPHVKEFERLAGKSENDFERLNKLSNFAECCGCFVVLKGAYSVVATPYGRLFFNMSGNPGMAKGGSGDVLTGVLLALVSSGMPMEDAVRTAVFAHGLSADLLLAGNGCRGISSGMIADNMGMAWAMLEGTSTE